MRAKISERDNVVYRLLKNWSYLAVSDLVQQIIGFLVVILLARKLSPEGYGQFNVILSLATIFAVFANFGMTSVTIREVSLHPQGTPALIRKVLIPLRSLSLMVAIVMFYGYHYFFTVGLNDWSVFVIWIIVGLTLWDLSESIAFGHEATNFSAILNVAYSFTWLGIIFLMPDEYLNVFTVTLVYSSLYFIKAISYIAIVYKRFYLPSLREIKIAGISYINFLKMALPYVWLLVISVLANQLPIQFLNSNAGAREVGFYAVGYKLMIPIGIAVGTAFKAIFPSLTKLYAKNKEEFARKIRVGFNLIFIMGTTIAVLMSITSKYWLTMVFGTEYKGAIIVFDFLVWFSVITILDSLLSNALSSAYKERALAILATIDFIIVLPILYYGSFYGAFGVSLTKLVTGILMLTYHWIVFVRVLKVEIKIKELSILIGLFVLSQAVCLLMSNVVYQLLMITIVLGTASIIKGSPVPSTLMILKNNMYRFSYYRRQ